MDVMAEEQEEGPSRKIVSKLMLIGSSGLQESSTEVAKRAEEVEISCLQFLDDISLPFKLCEIG